MKPLTLSTKRLTLRSSIDKDSESLFKNYCSDIYSSRFLTRKPHVNIEQTTNFLKDWCINSWVEESNRFAWVIALEDTDEAIGVFLVEIEGHKAQIHYGISRAFEGKGFITEAGNAAVDWLLRQSNLQCIWAVCDLSNQGSIKVLEKLGFNREGVLRKWLILPYFGSCSARDCYMYARV